jgi:tRNA (guanine37-N1)-methyltransferase
VPTALLSGHHADIARWRREQALRVTAQRRPDLLARAREQGQLSAADESFLRSDAQAGAAAQAAAR